MSDAAPGSPTSASGQAERREKRWQVDTGPLEHRKADVASERSADRRFRDLYDAYAAQVYTYFKRRTDDPRDCTADTFLVAWRRLDDVPEGDAALPWLYGVSKRVLLNHRRSRKRFRQLSIKLRGMGATPTDDPEAIVVQRAEDDELIDALRRLPPRDQEVLRLATWEELPHAVIGEHMGCSAHAIDQRIYRATRRLARELRRTGHRHVEGTIPATEPRGEAR